MEESPDHRGSVAPARLDIARESFFDRSLDLLALADRDGYLVDVNDAWTATLGWDKQELLARPYVEFVHPDDVDATIAATRSLAEGAPIIGFVNRYRHRNGTWVWLAWNSYMEREFDLVFGIARDVTHEHELEQSLRHANAELLSAAERRDQFVATASHELRTPVTSIAGFASTMRERWASFDETDLQRFVEIIDVQAGRLVRIVDDLLTMARLDAGGLPLRIEAVPVRPMLEEARLLANGVDMNVECAGDVVARVDPDLLAQVLANLVTNSIRYGRPPIRLAATSVGARVRIEVADHGEGVPQSFRDQLFEKFTQVPRNLSDPAYGTGLGLSIVRGIVEAMGGTVRYEEAPGGGAAFVVELDAAAAER